MIPQSGLIRWCGPTISVISFHPETLFLDKQLLREEMILQKIFCQDSGCWQKANIGQRSDNPWKKAGSCMRRAEVCSCLGPPHSHTAGSVGWFYQWGQVGTTATLVPEGPDLIWRWWVRHNDHSIFHDNINTDGQQTEKRSGSQCRGLVQANNRLTDWLETY